MQGIASTLYRRIRNLVFDDQHRHILNVSFSELGGKYNDYIASGLYLM